MLRVVLDANIYVSAAVRADGPPGHIIERFLRDAAFQIVVSQAIVDEVLRAFAYPKVRKYIRRGLDPELWFEDIVVLAQFVAGKYEVAGVSDDPDDDKYIAAAVEGREPMSMDRGLVHFSSTSELGWSLRSISLRRSSFVTTAVRTRSFVAAMRGAWKTRPASP